MVIGIVYQLFLWKLSIEIHLTLSLLRFHLFAQTASLTLLGLSPSFNAVAEEHIDCKDDTTSSDYASDVKRSINLVTDSIASFSIAIPIGPASRARASTFL